MISTDTMLAIFPYYLLSLAALLSAIRLGLNVYRNYKVIRCTLGLMAALLACAGWALTFISAGPNPIVARDDMLPHIRLLLLLAGALWLIAVVWDLFRSIRIQHKDGE